MTNKTFKTWTDALDLADITAQELESDDTLQHLLAALALTGGRFYRTDRVQADVSAKLEARHWTQEQLDSTVSDYLTHATELIVSAL